MIRVIYRWQIFPGTESKFCAWWHEGTQSIRQEQRGALGSVLLRSHGTTSTFVGVARWQTRAALVAFWKSAESRPNPYGDLVAVEILDEIDDLDVKGSVPSDP
jgi:heme-degrading monooxygenase HmoA